MNNRRVFAKSKDFQIASARFLTKSDDPLLFYGKASMIYVGVSFQMNL